MGTTIKPEISMKNRYWINRHRYYELKHFCLQYPSWERSYVALDGMTRKSVDIIDVTKTNEQIDVTGNCAVAKTYYLERMRMVRDTAMRTDEELGDYIFQAVTKGLSYTQLKTQLEIPCSKDTYYERYRRFFWLLNQARQ